MTYKYSAKQNNESEDDDFISPQFLGQLPKRAPYTQFEYKFTVRELHFYISEDIKEPEAYIGLIHTLNICTENDVVYLHLNLSGGRLDTGIQIINAMNNSQAHVITVLECMAHSLGTLIFLSGNELIVNDSCMMLFHNFSGGVIGKGNELTSQLNATVEWFSTLARDIYIPFLSEAEFNRIIKGEDIWMQSTEIRTRLDNIAESKAEKPVKRKTKKIDKEVTE